MKQRFNMVWKQLLSSAFLIALIPICLADPRDICPSDDLIEPCICRQHFEDGRAIVTCTKIAGNDVVISVLNKTSDYGYGYFMVDLSSINYIPAEAFDIKKITKLYIVDTTMISLFNKAPNATDLQGITAYGLKLSRAIQWDLFTSMPNLKNLTIENSPLRNVDEQFVKYAPKTLERITISNCSISKLHDEAFASMTDLMELVMDTGKIKVVKRSMFPNPGRQIVKISMKNQKIESLPEDLFTDMRYLSKIWLTNNLISQVSENVLKPVFEAESLRSLLLDGNPIKCNCNMRWIAMITVREGALWNNFLGKCEEPKNLHGKDLVDLTPNHFQHCEGT